jgi:preprotein translocase subunit Sec63
MTYTCPAWKFAADKCGLKLQNPQSNDALEVVNLATSTPVRDVHKAFKLLHIHYYITLCRQQAEATQNHENANVCNTANLKPYRDNKRGLEVATVKLTTDHVITLPL